MSTDGIGPDGLTDIQRTAGYAPRRHSVAAGVRQLKAEHERAFETPLSEAELRTGGGYLPAITDVDCTPRPRYGESQAAFLRRMASYGADVEALKRELRAKNREAALRQGTWPDGATYYFTQCACKWHGLRVADPEVARREYDAHECLAEGIGDAAIDRAQAHAGKATMPPRRAAVLKPALEQPPETIETLRPAQQDLDDLEQRVALLEPKP